MTDIAPSAIDGPRSARTGHHEAARAAGCGSLRFLLPTVLTPSSREPSLGGRAPVPTKAAGTIAVAVRPAPQAKVRHPDLAPPGSQGRHERHLKAINEAADVRSSGSPRASRGGRSAPKRGEGQRREGGACAARPDVDAGAPRGGRTSAVPRGLKTARQRPVRLQVPDHSRRSSTATHLSLRDPTRWGVGAGTGIYFTGAGDDIQQWARVSLPDRRADRARRLAPVRRLQHADAERRAINEVADQPERTFPAAARARRGRLPRSPRRFIYARDRPPIRATRSVTAAHDEVGLGTLAGSGDLPAGAGRSATGRRGRECRPTRAAPVRARASTRGRRTRTRRPRGGGVYRCGPVAESRATGRRRTG